jgi:hypothetical protein
MPTLHVKEAVMGQARSITDHELKALRALPGPNGGGMSTVELAALMGLGRRAVVGLLNALEHDHLIARCADSGWRKTSAGKIAANPQVERVRCQTDHGGVELSCRIGGRDRTWHARVGGWFVRDVAARV